MEHRAAGGNYKGLDTGELREQLLHEQGHICCYCMKRIPQTLSEEQIARHYPKCKIEHVLSQENHPDQELNYQNLLIACNGNHGQPKKMQTCDTFKGDRDLSFNPADRYRNIEQILKYLPNGEIRSDDRTIDRELDEILNLNTLDLKKVRAEYYKNIQQRISTEGKQRAGKEIQRRFYEAKKRKLLEMVDNKFSEYCMIGVYLINKKLRKF